MEIKYSEKVKSFKTTLLFLFLSVVFIYLTWWRVSAVGYRFLPGLFALLGLVFIFYVINYRTLEISIDSTHLKLKFGIISWKTPLTNIQDVCLDDSPALIKYGGAGVHFAFVGGRYRAYFNFLEYPRLLIFFGEKQGWTEALVFSTRQPEQVLSVLNSRRAQL